jgi:hypothetical protein
VRALLLFLAGSLRVCAPDEWISLFNGKDLSGWSVNENPQTFRVQDGAIVAHGDPSHCFYVGKVRKHDFKNFELKVDVKTNQGSNGGIYFHTVFQAEGWPEKGFEAQVNNTNGDPIKSGSLYHVKDLGADDIKDIVKDGEWFTEHIVVRDNTITILLNGKKVVEWTQPEGWNGTPDFPERKIDHGTIAFQGHDPDSTVQYKNVLIKLL